MKYKKLSFGALFIFGLLSINNAMAQGPVQPEAMQFEPVDVTDVVNLATGDFVYTIPIMNVPGPAGDYPIVLSYHSGIGPNQPATWVGLGWTLNPGAVNRTLSGYPDDYNGDKVITTHQASSKSSWGISLGAGWGPVGVNMNYDHESGKVGVNAMVSVFGAISAIENANFGGIGKHFNADINVTVGTSGVSANASLSGSRGIKDTKLGIGGSISAGTNGANLGGGLNRGYGKNESGDGYKGSYSIVSTGASLTSQGLGGNFSVAGTGFSSVTTSGNGNLDVTSRSIRIPLPGKFWVSLGYSKWKWSLNDTYNESSYGALYQYDNYDPDINVKNERHVTEETLFPSIDAYQATAQGMSGSFAPMFDYHYRLFDNVNNDEKGYLDRTYNNSTFASNSYIHNGANFRFYDDTGYNFTNKNSNSDFNTDNNFTRIDNEKIGSKKVVPVIGEHSGKILGFKITSPDGIVYEFMETVENYYQYSENDFDDSSSDYTNTSSLIGSFSTSWLLTAIKGPDYIDRGTPGVVDDQDWGYWIELDYENTSSLQIWRAPFTGTAMGGSEFAKQYSFGVREVVYLKSIESKTHIAIFESELSKNGKNANVDLSQYDHEIDRVKTYVSGYSHTFDGDYSWVESLSQPTDVIYSITHYSSTTDGISVCKVDQFTANDVDFSFNAATNKTSVTFPPFSLDYSCPSGVNYTYSNSSINLINFVDKHASTHKKLNSVSLYNKFAGSYTPGNEISKVEFDYNYSLRPYSNGSIATQTDGATKGSLTLTSVSFKGQNNTLVSPPYRFQYAYDGAPGSSYNPNYHSDHYDIWGSYRYSTEDLASHKNTPQKDKGKADLAAAWSLTGIQMPTGSEIEIEYESDDFSTIDYRFLLNADIPSFVINETESNGNLISVYDNMEGKGLSDYNLNDYKYIYLSPIPVNTTADFVKITNAFRILSIDSNRNEIEIETEFNSFNNPSYNYVINFANPELIYGGGTRVKRVSTIDGNEFNSTVYQYRKLNGTASSGVTATLPTDKEKLENDLELNNSIKDELEFAEIFMDGKGSYGRPNPGVIYSNVQVINVDHKNIPISGYTEYEFYTSYDYRYKPNFSENHFYIEDRTGIYGKPKATTYFEQINNSGVIDFRPIKRTENHYVFSDDLLDVANVKINELNNITDANQPLGVVQQKHASYVAVAGGGTDNDFKKVVERTYFNVYGTGQTVTEYFYDQEDSKNESSSITSTGKTIAYDVGTGSPLITVQQTADEDEVLISKNIPAYWMYDSLEVRNMLTQSVQEISYRKTANINDPNLKNLSLTGSDVISSSITTWSDEWPGDANGVWRKNDTYTYVSVLPYLGFPFDKLDYIGTDYPQIGLYGFKMTSNITQYDVYGHAIETVNEDGTYQSVLYDTNNKSLVLAVASNAKESEVTYDNFENGTTSSEFYTGQRSVTTFSITTPSNDPIHGSKYKVGMWVKGSGATVNGVAVPGRNNSTWVFYQVLVDNSSNVGGSGGYFDDVTVIPEYASISYFAYDALTWKVTAMTGPDHRTSFYEYDDAGRLIGVKDQDGKLLQSHDYTYGQSHYIESEDNNYKVFDQVNFELKSIDANIIPSTPYTWDFGDGTRINTSNLTTSHSYSVGGNYQVSVTFNDQNNSTHRTFNTVKIDKPLSVSLTNLNTVNYGGTNSDYYEVHVMAEIEGGTEPYHYDWFVKDHNQPDWESMPYANGYNVKIGRSVTNTTHPAPFTIKFKVTDFLGESKEVELQIVNTTSYE